MVYLKTLPLALNSTFLIKAKLLEMCLPCPLVLKWWQVSMVKLKLLLSVYFVAYLINHLLTVFIDSSYSALKVIMKPFDIKQKKAAFQDNIRWCQ